MARIEIVARAEQGFMYKGWSGYRYEIEEVLEDLPEYDNYALVRLGSQIYECVKVKLDGKCIFNDYDDEEVVSDAFQALSVSGSCETVDTGA